MNFSWFKLRYFLYMAIIGLWFIWFANTQVLSGESYIAIDCSKDIGSYPIGIVLGAGVTSPEKASDVYADRLQTAVDLYNNKKIAKILVSGAQGRVAYDEVNVGRDYLLDNKVSPDDIFLDYAGFDTYDSIYHAKNEFGINKALVITQNYHLPRALYYTHELKMGVLGCSADLHTYQNIGQMKFREIGARVKAWLIIAFNTNPKYVGETYDISGKGQQSWDQFSNY